jgi:hypothetical protein
MPDNKKIAINITANTRQLQRDMRNAGREVKTFERQVTTTGNKLRQMRMRFQQSGIFGRGGGALRTAAGFAGVFGFSQMIQEAKAGDAALTDIAITGNLTNKELANLKKTMLEISNNTAKSTRELGSFVATVTTMTGDAKGATEALGGIGEVMVATGASGSALAGTFVKLTTTMGLLPKEAAKAFNIFRAQEKLGSITFQNIASQIGKLTGPAGVFGAEAKGLKGVRTLGGLFQITQRGFDVGQEGEAANAASKFLANLGRRSQKIKRTFGVDVFDPSGRARDLPTVFEELGKAFNLQKGKFRTKGIELFGERGIRAAQMLRDAAAAPGGFAGGVGTFASANALLRQAGQTDVIGADARRRRESASSQFDKQMNILRNTFKKHMRPLFTELAKTLQKWGPDLVKALKFVLEHSKGLLKLWLGWKGVTFFKRLMAPVQAAAGGGVGGIPGISGTGGGYAMMPGGQMMRFPSGKSWPKLGPHISSLQPNVGSFWAPAGPGRSGFSFMRPGMSSDIQLLRAEQARRAQMIQAEQARRARFRRYAGMGLSAGGQMAGMASMMGLFKTPNYGPAGADMAANMALMSGNPYAMAPAAVWKGTNKFVEMFTQQGAYGQRTLGDQRADALVGQMMAPGLLKDVFLLSQRMNAGKALKGIFSDVNVSLANAFGGPASQKYYTETESGVRARQEQDRIFKIFGGAYEGETRPFGISNPQAAELGMKYGSAGLSRLKGRVGMSRDKARAVAEAQLRAANQKVDEESLRRKSPEYAKLADLYVSLDKMVARLLSGKPINVIAQLPDGSTPGKRVQENSKLEGEWKTIGE